MELYFDRRANGITIMRPVGRLDLLTAASVKRRLATALTDGYTRIVVDLADVTFLDSSGLGVLIGGLKATRLAGGDLRIARPTEQARVILELTTLDRILQPFADLEEALGEFAQTMPC